MTINALQLGDLPVRTVSARVRPFIPDIQRQLDRGVAMATIVAALNERGIAVTAGNLAKVLYRARKSQPGTRVSDGQSPSVIASPPHPTRQSSLQDIPPGVDPAKWARMSLREQGEVFADKYVNMKPRLFAAKV